MDRRKWLLKWQGRIKVKPLRSSVLMWPPETNKHEEIFSKPDRLPEDGEPRWHRRISGFKEVVRLSLLIDPSKSPPTGPSLEQVPRLEISDMVISDGPA